MYSTGSNIWARNYVPNKKHRRKAPNNSKNHAGGLPHAGGQPKRPHKECNIRNVTRVTDIQPKMKMGRTCCESGFGQMDKQNNTLATENNKKKDRENAKAVAR